MAILAYIDPATGTLIVQFLIAGVVGGIAFFRESIGRALGFFKRREPPDQDTTPNGT
jgi:hypothetical protein